MMLVTTQNCTMIYSNSVYHILANKDLCEVNCHQCLVTRYTHLKMLARHHYPTAISVPVHSTTLEQVKGGLSCHEFVCRVLSSLRLQEARRCTADLGVSISTAILFLLLCPENNYALGGVFLQFLGETIVTFHCHL